MKIYLYCTMLFLLCPSFSNAQENGTGGNFSSPPSCLSETERNAIATEIAKNIELLKPYENPEQKNVLVNDLLFPVVFTGSIPGYQDVYNISNYVDHDDSPGIQDFKCSSVSYDGHQGTDFFPFPFEWYLYKNELIQVVSAAAGTIVTKVDGNADTNCEWKGEWNTVAVLHEDGSYIIYGHMKSGGLTEKVVGDKVARGEFLGIVASSGFSTGVHLHMECYDQDRNLVDPFAGPCNSLNETSLWETKPVFSGTKINALLTHNKRPAIGCGPENETAVFTTTFYPGDELYLGVYLSNYRKGDVVKTDLYRPDGSLYDSFNTSNPRSSFGWFWNARRYLLTNSDPQGTWSAQSFLRNSVVTHTFEFLDNTTSTAHLGKNEVRISPNPATDWVTVKGDIGVSATYRITDGLGREVRTGRINNGRISLSGLPRGVYYLLVKDGQSRLLPNKLVKH